MTMVTLITAKIIPTIIPILELLEEIQIGIENEVTEVNTVISVVASQCINHKKN